MRSFFLAALVPAALSAQVCAGFRAPAFRSTKPSSWRSGTRRQVISAQNAIHANEATVRHADVLLLPDDQRKPLVVVGRRTVFDNKGDIVTRNNVTPWNWSRRLSANWLLFDGGDRNFQLRVARANVTAAEANEVAAADSRWPTR